MEASSGEGFVVAGFTRLFQVVHLVLIFVFGDGVDVGEVADEFFFRTDQVGIAEGGEEPVGFGLAGADAERLFSRRSLHLQAAIASHAGAGRDEATDDDVFLQAHEVVHLALDGGFGEHPGGLLEGGRGEEAVRGEGGLGDTEEHPFRGGFRAAPLANPLVHFVEVEPIVDLAGQQFRVTGVQDPPLAQHLPDDDLDVLIVDGDAVGGVDGLDFLDHVFLDGADALHLQDLLRIQRAFGERVAGAHLVAFLRPAGRRGRAPGGGARWAPRAPAVRRGRRSRAG